MLLGALARAVARRAGDFDVQNLTNTAWAFAMACWASDDLMLFAALARSAEQQASEFNAQNHANTVWAFTKVGYRHDEKLFAALLLAMQQRVK